MRRALAVVAVVACVPATPPPETPVVWNVQAEEPAKGHDRKKSPTAFFCHAVDQLGRFCFVTPQGCLQSSDRHEGTCAVFSTAHCMSFKRVIDNKRAGLCFSDSRVCRDTSVEMAASSDFEEVGECHWLAADPAAVQLAEIDLDELSATKTGWWCSLSDRDGIASFCARTRPHCERMRARVGGPFAECMEQKRAACFTYWSILDQAEKTECRSSFGDCQAIRTVTMGRSDDAEKVGACTATE